MKLLDRILFVALIVSVLFPSSSYSQGIVLHFKDGSRQVVPYLDIDSITTYDYDDFKEPIVDPITGNKTYSLNGITFKMIKVGGGSFDMGATTEQEEGGDPGYYEMPVHNVTLSDYYIAETEVTQALWSLLMVDETSVPDNIWTQQRGHGDNYPAYHVSYEDCLLFIERLNRITGENFRLPTEAEWEFAARGGNNSQKYIYSGGNNLNFVGWHNANAASSTQPVGSKEPNELGIYDMSGNAWEWCLDWIDFYPRNPQTNPTGPSNGYNRILRGGASDTAANLCRISYRHYALPADRSNLVGLRLAQ